MSIFEKTSKAVKEISETVYDSAKNIGTTIYSASLEQSELAGLKVQKSVIEKKLHDSYAEIGRKYVDYMLHSEGSEAFDVSEIIENMKPELDKIASIESEIAEKELNAKKEEEAKRFKKAQEDFETEKAKLDKALEMDIITQDEYYAKMSVVQRKLDNYELLRKIDLQYQMGIISNEEYKAKVDAVLKG